MSEKSMSKDTRKNVILLHIAVMCFSCSGVIGQYDTFSPVSALSIYNSSQVPPSLSGR